MDIHFLADNAHKRDAENFQELDPHLSKLRKLRYVHTPQLLERLPVAIPGLYTLTGGCLTGKTTLLKLWITKLLAAGIPADAITFVPCSLVNNYQALIDLLEEQLMRSSSAKNQYLLIDDVNSISHWDKAISALIRKNLLCGVVLVMSSADSTICHSLSLIHQENTLSQVNFHIYPLSFYEFVELKYPGLSVEINDLFKEFDQYLMHGGFLIAINEIAIHGRILDETLACYAESLIKEMLFHGKHKHFCREIFSAIIDHYGQPITWNKISKDISIDHPKTINNYMMLLETLDAVFVQYALLEKSLLGAPKKARKLMFTDPFIFHAIKSWLSRSFKNAFEMEIKPALENAKLITSLVKSCVIIHYRQVYPIFYIKAEGEIDLAYLYQQRFWPIMVTWKNQMRTKDLKQILKYSNGKILTNALRSEILQKIRTEPVPKALLKLSERYHE